MVEPVEVPITLSKAKAFYLRTYGVNVSKATLKSWAKNGVRGVWLKAEIHGGRYYTKPSWVREFYQRRQNPLAEPVAGGRGLMPQDLRQSEAARKELIRRGLIRDDQAKVPRVRATN